MPLDPPIAAPAFTWAKADSPGHETIPPPPQSPCPSALALSFFPGPPRSFGLGASRDPPTLTRSQASFFLWNRTADHADLIDSADYLGKKSVSSAKSA